MLSKIDEDLKQLQIRSDAQDAEIQRLYLALNEINEKKESLQSRKRPIINLFDSVRPEVMYQILEFVDTRSYLKFRLISKRCNEIIILTAPQKIQQMNHQIVIFESDIQKLLNQESQQPNEQDEQLKDQLQRAQQEMSCINKSDIVELKSLANPPVSVLKVFQCLCIFMSSPQQLQYSWKDAQKLLHQMNFLQQLLQLDISNITENQLAKLAIIDSIDTQIVQCQSKAASNICRFLKAAIESRRTLAYTSKFKNENLKKQVNNKKKIVELLQKLSNK